MKSPFEFTWALPEFDGVGLVRDEKFLQFVKYCSRMNLKRIRFTIEDFSSRVDKVSYDNNLGDVVDGACLIDATSYRKQLRLHASVITRAVWGREELCRTISSSS